MARLTAALLIVSLAYSCGPPHTPVPQPDSAAHEEAATTMPLSELGQLQVFVTSQLTDGRNLKLRGLIRNPYPEAVEGIRLIFRILSAVSVDARELDRRQQLMDERLASGEQTALRFDVQTMYAGAAGSGFVVQAFGITRGGIELPLPPDWKE